MAKQLRAAERRQAAICRGALPDVIVDYLLQFPEQRHRRKRGHVLLDVILDDPRQFPEQRLGWKRGHVRIVGGENLFQVRKLIEDPGAERVEWNLDLGEQPGNEMVNFTSFQRRWFSRRHPFTRGRRWR